jgi:hypothetical protein
MKKIIVSQMMPPMGDPLAAMGATPPVAPTSGPGMAGGNADKVIRVPLSNLGLILADAQIEKKLMEDFENNELELANEVWVMYGGKEDGGVNQARVGKRSDEVEVDDEEIKTTEKSRWERLPDGQNLDDLEIELSDFANAIKFLSYGFAKNKAKEQPAAGGGMPGMASRKLENMVKIARNLDKMGLYRIADRIM